MLQLNKTNNKQIKMTKQDFIFFWGGIYSQWFPSKFVIDGILYNTAEQYMMAKKALLFSDFEALAKIMKSTDPSEQKALGKTVKGFDKANWETYCREYVYQGNYAKFTQNPKMMAELLATGDKEIVEASPTDNIWGIGLDENNPLAWNKETWQGTNWLGEAIMRVRTKLREEAKSEVRVGVSVIMINNKQEVLVGKRRGSHGAGMLSVPGGHLEFGETYIACCDRELMEEIGVDFGAYTPIGFSEDFFVKDGVDKHYTTLYFVVDEVDSDNLKIQNLEPEKCEGWEWVPFAKLPDNMFCDTYNKIRNYLHYKL